MKVGFSRGDNFKQTIFFWYVIKYMLIFGGKFPIKYHFHEIWVSLTSIFRWNLYKSPNLFLFNIGCYWELFSGITPNRPHCMANNQNRIYNICYWCCFCQFALRLLYNSIYSIFSFVCIQNLRCLSFRSIWVYSRGF